MSKDNREECTKCKGAGGFEYPDEISPEHQWSECDECNGTGEVTIDSGVDANGWISVDKITDLPEERKPVHLYQKWATGEARAVGYLLDEEYWIEPISGDILNHVTHFKHIDQNDKPV